MCETKNEVPMSEKKTLFWKKLLFSDILLAKSYTQKIAYIGVLTALSIVASMFLEFKFLDVQFSLTILVSVLTGVLIGPLSGGVAVFLGDLIGYLYNSWGLLYYWWVGLSTALMAVIAGLVMRLPFKFRGSGYLKLALICILVLAVCSVGVNTTGFYVFYTRIGFTQKSLGLVEKYFGGVNTYFAYAIVRLIFLGQLWNSLFNYALLFVAVPLLNAAKPLGIRIE